MIVEPNKNVKLSHKKIYVYFETKTFFALSAHISIYIVNILLSHLSVLGLCQGVYVVVQMIEA